MHHEGSLWDAAREPWLQTASDLPLAFIIASAIKEDVGRNQVFDFGGVARMACREHHERSRSEPACGRGRASHER